MTSKCVSGDRCLSAPKHESTLNQQTIITEHSDSQEKGTLSHVIDLGGLRARPKRRDPSPDVGDGKAR